MPEKAKSHELPFVWELEKNGKRSFLIGSVHITPFSYKESLERYISQVEDVALELAPDNIKSELKELKKDPYLKKLKEANAKNPSLDKVLDDETRNKVKKHVGRLSYFLVYKRLKPRVAYAAIHGKIVTKNRKAMYGVEREAAELVMKQKKLIYGLESVKEQLESLASIPEQKWVESFKEIDTWDAEYQKGLDTYESGDLDALMQNFKKDEATYETAVGKRDPRLYERAKPLLEMGSSAIIIGAAHCEGFLRVAAADGYRIKRMKA